MALPACSRPYRILGVTGMAHISIENLVVEFAIFGANSRSLKNQILSQATGGRVMAGARDLITVRAIDGLNLEINDGDRIGLVGHNGSGKTTLLRVLAGIYKPSGGASLSKDGLARCSIPVPEWTRNPPASRTFICGDI